MDVTVAIICWNGRKLLEKNLPFVIKASENKKNNISEIIVVDDFSTDDSVDFLKTKYPLIRIIKHDRNYGYAKACNTAVSSANSPLVALLNLDVVPQEDFLFAGLKHFENKKVFSVSFNEGKFGPGKLSVKNGFVEIQPSEKTKSFSETDWPSGGSAVFKKEIWGELKGMNEIFLPFYFEDVDLGIRAKKLGYISYWEPKCKVIHEHEATINKDSFRINYINLIKQRNHLLVTWRNIQDFKALLVNIKFIVRRIIKGPGYLKIVLSAIIRLMLV